uniref:Uncharacterized protein n=1 Tax=Vespula pensylvanica TaxID=30213 RepID=A0A834P141_VESPE|nr:hypothetical protein H0235_009094 [Vespula pensylvanica]
MQEATRNRERRGQFPNDSDLSPLVCSGHYAHRRQLGPRLKGSMARVKFASLRSHLEIQIYRETGKPRETGRHCKYVCLSSHCNEDDEDDEDESKVNNET